MSSTVRYFKNPYLDYDGKIIEIDYEAIVSLIQQYVSEILLTTLSNASGDERGDLYVGNAGIAFMFYKLSKSKKFSGIFDNLKFALKYIDKAKLCARKYQKHNAEKCSFLCGNAGIYATSMAISLATNNNEEYMKDLQKFSNGFQVCKTQFNGRNGCDEVLVGRAGYLSGIYWLNNEVTNNIFGDQSIIEICELIVQSGRDYSRKTNSYFPLSYQYHGTEYFGAAHGICSILHMLLESPWFKRNPGNKIFSNVPRDAFKDIKNTIDSFLDLQDIEGNFPIEQNDLREKRLVHWCHGAPGAIYLFAKSYILFEEQKYLNACILAGELVWNKGLLIKGPGICHGVAGNGYVFLILFRLTNNPKYLYRALQFMKFLRHENFLKHARIPDRPYSLYEGIAGTVCFLIDLGEPANASFPFMDIFK